MIWIKPGQYLLMTQKTSIAGGFFGQETLCYNVLAYLV